MVTAFVPGRPVVICIDEPIESCLVAKIKARGSCRDPVHSSHDHFVKALPHFGQRHGETICCTGITMDGQWRRQYPIHFRRLQDNQFSRWQWIEYDWLTRPPRKRQSTTTVSLCRSAAFCCARIVVPSRNVIPSCTPRSCTGTSKRSHTPRRDQRMKV